MTCDFQQFGILTSVNSDEPVQPPFKQRLSADGTSRQGVIIVYIRQQVIFSSEEVPVLLQRPKLEI